MIIDCHGHYTTEPKDLHRFRKDQTAAANAKDKAAMPPRSGLKMSDDEIRESIEAEPAQIPARARHRPDDLLAARLRHGPPHRRRERVSREWTEICNDLIHRVVHAVSRRTSSASASCRSRRACRRRTPIAELERCVKMGFVGCNLNPDPSGGYFNAPPMTDKWWYPFYEKMVELDVPAMIHVSGCCNPAQHTTGSYYLNADTMVFMQVILSDLFKDFPN